jgi:hypothetical protein
LNLIANADKFYRDGRYEFAKFATSGLEH